MTELLAKVEVRELTAAREQQRAPVVDAGRARQLLHGLLLMMKPGSTDALPSFRRLMALSVYTDEYGRGLSSTARVYEEVIGAVGGTAQGQHLGPTPWPVTAEKLLVFGATKMLGKGFLRHGGRCQAETVRKYVSGLRRTSARLCPTQLMTDEDYKDTQLLLAALGRRVDKALPIQATPLDSAALDRLLDVVDWASVYERQCVLVAVWSRAMGARTSEVRRWVGRMDVFDVHPTSPRVMTMRFGDRKWARSGVPMVVPMVVPMLTHPDPRRCFLTLLEGAVRTKWQCSLRDALR